jgi:hypothetical protein
MSAVLSCPVHALTMFTFTLRGAVRYILYMTACRHWLKAWRWLQKATAQDGACKPFSIAVAADDASEVVKRSDISVMKRFEACDDVDGHQDSV